MIDVLNDNIENGLDSPAFRKLKYRVAVLNELQFDRIGFPGIVALIAENPNYNIYHQVLHKMLVRRKDEFAHVNKESNPLLAALFDEAVSNKSFLSMVKKERSKKSLTWLKYRKTISGLHLSS